MMNFKLLFRTLLLASLLIGSSVVYADDDLDVTMKMVPPDVDLPDAVTRVIALPLHTPETAKTNSQKGLETANDARERIEVPDIELPEQAKGRGRN